MANKVNNDSKGLAATIKSVFPLLQIDSIPNTASGSHAIAQLIIAVYLAYRVYPTISIRDILFCVFFPAYLLLANNLRFANNLVIRQRPKDHKFNVSVVASEFFSASKSAWLMRYTFLAATCGLLLPLITVIKAPIDVADLAIPHLYVLWVQIIGESAVMFNPYVHRFIALLLPIGFNTYRMSLVIEWFMGSLSLFQNTSLATESLSVWYALGLALSGVNVLLWAYNLFVVLLLRIMPEFLSNDKCEAPNMRVISLPFIKE